MNIDELCASYTNYYATRSGLFEQININDSESQYNLGTHAQNNGILCNMIYVICPLL